MLRTQKHHRSPIMDCETATFDTVAPFPTIYHHRITTPLRLQLMRAFAVLHDVSLAQYVRYYDSSAS